MIIGITGENCAGKDTIAEYLQKKGFYYLSLSDILRDELAKAGKPVTRENLIEKGNELRTTHGPGVLSKLTMQKMDKSKNYVVISIRNPVEVQELAKDPNFTLVYVTAPSQTRFERMKSRNRAGDPLTLEGFIAVEKAEIASADKNRQQLAEVFKLANKTITNDSDLVRLYDSVDKALGEISADFKSNRPSWDEYFMGIAKMVASRSNCMKRHVAAVIVKDKRIVSTGYNGTPRGCRNCDAGGCPRCNSFADSGTRLDECYCSHAEENAICQAAYHGISIKDASIYITYSPCLTCTRMIINSGIKEVIYNENYPLAQSSIKLMQEAGVKARQMKLKD